MADVQDELELAAFIREIDGNNRMGACKLAEKILEWQEARAEPVAYCFTDVEGRPKEFCSAPDSSHPEDMRVIKPLYKRPVSRQVGGVPEEIVESVHRSKEILVSLIKGDMIQIRPSDRDCFVKEWSEAMTLLETATQPPKEDNQ